MYTRENFSHLMECQVFFQLLDGEDMQQLVHRGVFRIILELCHSRHPEQVMLPRLHMRGSADMREDSLGKLAVLQHGC